MSVQARVSKLRDRLLSSAERRLPALTRMRQPETTPLTLRRQRLYVLPTGAGIFFGIILTSMLLGALNYNNNPALLLSFLIGSAVNTALLQGYLDLLGLRVLGIDAEPVHAGQPLQLNIWIDAEGNRERRQIAFQLGAHRSVVDLQADHRQRIELPMETHKRGWVQPGRIQISTRYPLGLFRVWSWIHPQKSLLVYPAPEAHGPPLPLPSTEGRRRWRRSPGEQLHSLREYRIGDPRRLIAWKRSAQTGQLLVREFEAPTGGQIALDFDELNGLNTEQRISRLTHWLLEAERQGLRTSLRIPGRFIAPANGPAHRRECLAALALLPERG